MKYNFDEIIERRGTNSYKWDLVKEDGVIPMWVADMDFQTAPCIIGPAEVRSSRHLRLHPRTGFLLRSNHQLVRTPPPVEHRERLDSLYFGRSASHLLLPEGNLHARREGFGADSSVQLFLLKHYQQWLRSSGK